MTGLHRAVARGRERAAEERPHSRPSTIRSWPCSSAVIVKFGGLVDGPRLAIDRANTYSGSLVPAKFLNYNGSTVVHPHLQAALTKAETYLKPKLATLPKEEVDGIDAAVKKMWSRVIRPNQNARHKLSDHRFGWAIDIDAAKNPNIGKGAGLAAVAPIAGKNPRATKTAELTADKVQTSAIELRKLSRDYVTAMSTDTTAAAVLQRLANDGRTAAKLPVLESGVGATLVAAVKTAKAADRATAVQNAVWPDGEDLSPAVSGKGKSKKVKKPAAPAQLQESIATIETVGTAYRTPFGKKGARVAAKTEGSAGSVAAHGFLSLPPALFAALSGSDAGGLIWLGTGEPGLHAFRAGEGTRTVRRIGGCDQTRRRNRHRLIESRTDLSRSARTATRFPLQHHGGVGRAGGDPGPRNGCRARRSRVTDTSSATGPNDGPSSECHFHGSGMMCRPLQCSRWMLSAQRKSFRRRSTDGHDRRLRRYRLHRRQRRS